MVPSAEASNAHISVGVEDKEGTSTKSMEVAVVFDKYKLTPANSINTLRHQKK